MSDTIREPGGVFDGVLLLSDYDGTLTGNDGLIPEANLEAARYFTERGGRFTVCTGRTLQGFRQFCPDVVNAPIILANGAAAYDLSKDEPVFADCVGEEGVRIVRLILERFPGASIEMYPFGSTFTVNPSYATVRHFEGQKIRFSIIDDPGKAPLPWQKLMVLYNGSTKPIQEFVSGLLSDIHFLPTDGVFLEFMQKGVDKGSGLLKLADAMGIKRDMVFAAGDGYNDVEMLRAVTSFCPSDGDENAKKAADEIGGSRDEGIIAFAVKRIEEMLRDRR